jgi:transposase
MASLRHREQQADFVPFGVGYPLWQRNRVVSAAGKASAVAAQTGVSTSSVYRYRQLLATTGSVQRRPFSGAQAHVMDEVNLERVRLLTHAAPGITTDNVRTVLRELGTDVSTASVSRAWKRLDFTRKRLRTYSAARDEARRTRFWTNGPVGPVGEAGVFGVPSLEFVDIDEAGVEITECNAHYGHAPRGQRADAPGVVRFFL